ncbi:MAG: DNA polymerase III subunit delta [Bryobacteraceae bacterium]
MTPQQFMAKIARALAPAYLFLGPDTYWRDRCRRALLDQALTEEEREEGLTRHGLNEVSLMEVIDDARSLSLFASRRLILVSQAESALPRTKASDDEDSEGGREGGAEALAAYLRDPSPGVVLLFDCSRYGFEGDDKKKLERVREFYKTIPDAVELRHADTAEARAEAAAMAKAAGIEIDRAALDLLVESLGADVARIAVEIEKLRLFGRTPVDSDVISSMVPDARATTIFALVNALGRKDRVRSLGVLDTLMREGEYLPLALAFLSTQFRMALIAREAGLRSSGQIQGHFSKLGVPMWGSRAEAVQDTAARFEGTQLRHALELIFVTDRDLRSARPDDRTVMERFVFALTG